MNAFKNFKNVLWFIWKHLNLPEPDRLQYEAADYLQHSSRRRILKAFRGFGKSWITAAYVIWLMLNNNDVRILVVSASLERAAQFTTFVRKLIDDIPEFNHLKPRKNQRDSVLAFDIGNSPTSQSPTLRAVGVLGQMTGSRADEIIADDVEVPSNSDTITQRFKLSERVKEFEAILKPNGRITYLGTPQCEDSLYKELLNRGYEDRVIPILYPTEKMENSYGGTMSPTMLEELANDKTLREKPVVPERFNEMEIIERRLSYGNSGFNLQFMLDTSLSDADKYPLKLSDLVVADLAIDVAPTKIIYSNDPQKAIQDLPSVGMGGDRYYRPQFISEQFEEYTGRAMFIDPSGRGADKTTWCVVNELGGNLFLLDYGSLDGGYTDEVMIALCEVAKKYKVNLIQPEDNFGDGMFNELLKKHLIRIYPCTVEGVRHHTQKEKRIIDTLEPVFNQHRLIVNRKVIEDDYKRYGADKEYKYRLFYQVTRMTREKGALIHDDGVDVLAMGVAYWLQALSQDQDSIEQEYKQKKFNDMLEKYDYDSGLSGKVKGPNFLGTQQ